MSEACEVRSYLTEPEWASVFEHFGVHEALAYAGVSNTQLSIARHYGGATVQGQTFYYIDATDELVRADVVKWVERRRADIVIAQHQAEEAAARAAQGLLL